jgi:NitT/TauT family transport system substrate-binding protein
MEPVTELFRRRRLAAATSLLLPSLSLLPAARPARAAQPQRVKYISAFPVMSLIVANQTSIPRELGYFAEEGVQVEHSLSGAGGTTGAVQLVATGDQDIGSGSSTPMLQRASQGQDMGLVFFYNQVRDYSARIGVNAGSPARSFADLKGKAIGVPTLANEGVVFARYAAREAGLNPETDIRFVAVGVGAQALQALRSGQVDALSAVRGVFAQMETLGFQFRYLPLPAATRSLFGPGLFARRDFLQKNRAAAIGVGRAVAKGTLFMLTNPTAAVRIHWKIYPEQMPQGVAPEKALQDALHVLTTQLDGLRFGEGETIRQLGFYRPESVKALFDVYGYGDKIANSSRYFTNELIGEINAFDRDKVIEQARNFKMA